MEIFCPKCGCWVSNNHYDGELVDVYNLEGSRELEGRLWQCSGCDFEFWYGKRIKRSKK